VRYRHLRRTVIAVLATTAFVLLFGLLVRAVLEAGPVRRAAIRWIEHMARGYGAELAIGDLHWGLLPPGVRLHQVRLETATGRAEIASLQVDLGRIRLTRRTIELGTVAAKGVRLSLDGLPRPERRGGRALKLKVRHLELADVAFEGVDLPGGLALALDGVRAGWADDEGTTRGFAEIAAAVVAVGKLSPIDAAVRARYELSDDGLALETFHVVGEGFALAGSGRVTPGRATIEASGPLDVTWLDGLVKSRGLLAGNADITVSLDTSAPTMLKAEVRAPHIEAAGFPFDDLEGRIELAGRTLRGSLDRARFHGGTLRGSYRLDEIGGSWPHVVEIDGSGVALTGLLGDIRIVSAGLASRLDFTVGGAWNGKSIGRGRGRADVVLRPAATGLPVAGNLGIDLEGDGMLRFSSADLAIGDSLARWQGTLTLGSWEPAWAIAAEPARFEQILPLVNAWVGSRVLPEEITGSGSLEVNLSGPFTDLIVSTRIDAHPLSLPPVTLDRLVADATINRSMLRIGSAHLQIADGFGEIDGGLRWGEAAGDEQLDLTIRGSRIPLASAAAWADLATWVDSGRVSFDGRLTGPILVPRGSWLVDLEDLAIGGLTLGAATTAVELKEGRFTCRDLKCDRGLRAALAWDVPGAEVTGNLSWPGMSLAALGDPLRRLAGDRADVELDFDLPIGTRPTGELRAVSDRARVRVLADLDEVEVEGTVEGALEAHATLARDADGNLRGSGEIEMSSARSVLDLLAPNSGVPLAGTAHATFAVDWGDEPLPRIEGVLDSIDLRLADEPVKLIAPAGFTLSSDGFEVPGLRLRAREDDLFVRWTIDAEGGLRGNLSGTMDTLALRFLVPDWEPAGRATGVVEILGTADAPLFEGIAEIHRGSFRLPGTRTILSQVQGTVILSSGEVVLEGVDFRLMGGRASCTGRIFQGDTSLTLNLGGTATGVRFEPLPSLEARLSGDWQLNGPIDNLGLSGEITIDRMTLDSKESLANLLLSWIDTSTRPAAEGGLRLNLHVEAEETIELRNPFVRLTGSTSLDVSGTSNQPGLVGQIELVEGGEATLLGNRYEIERASLSFSNPQTIEPFVDLQASTWIQEYQVTVNLSGTFDHFVSTAVSTPPLSAPEIYSLLGVGQRRQDLGAGAVGLGLASSILTNELTSVLSQRAQLVLPIDQVRVDPFAADSTGNPTARLSVIKQLTPSWTVILQTTLSGEREQIVTSRWYLAPGLFLEAAQREDQSFTLDLKLRRPY
jgi:hypothetical protein